VAWYAPSISDHDLGSDRQFDAAAPARIGGRSFRFAAHRCACSASPHTQQRPPVYVIGDQRQPLRQVSKAALLQDGCWWAAGARAVVCIGLAKGQSRLMV